VSGVGGIGGINTANVLAMRAQILQRNAALSATLPATPATPATATPAPGSFDSAITDALASVNAAQGKADDVSTAYERGDTVDIAAVMLARQKASISFEATLQVRNKLLSAYKDIMSMPV
jgi:flagellar hook-basal body complex protein FliE